MLESRSRWERRADAESTTVPRRTGAGDPGLVGGDGGLRPPSWALARMARTLDVHAAFRLARGPCALSAPTRRRRDPRIRVRPMIMPRSSTLRGVHARRGSPRSIDPYWSESETPSRRSEWARAGDHSAEQRRVPDEARESRAGRCGASIEIIERIESALRVVALRTRRHPRRQFGGADPVDALPPRSSIFASRRWSKPTCG